MDLDVQRFINNKLNDIFIQKFSLNVAQLNESELEKDLLSSDIGFEPRDLVYLYFDIEKEFNISISQADIYEGRFNSYNNICDMIHNSLLKTNDAD